MRHRKVTVRILSNPSDKKLTGKTFVCSSQDVSVGGIQFSSRRPIDVNVTLEMHISFTRPIQHFVNVGRVVWMRKEDGKASYRIGVFFTDTDPKALTAWRKLAAALREP